MSNSTSTHRIYSNDLEVERLKQDKAATGDRLPVMRNRIARAHARKLTAILVVAQERGDRTVATAARQALALEKGTKVADTYELVPSRRPSRSKTVQALTLSPADAGVEDPADVLA